MSEEEYLDKVNNLREQIMIKRRINIKKIRPLAKELLSLAGEHKPFDDKTAGVAYYYLAEYYFFIKPDSKKYIKTLVKGIELQQKVNDYEMLCRSYNLMGIDASNCGNLELAFDYYRTAGEYASSDSNVPEMLAIAMYNLGTIYYKMHETKSASEMLKGSLKVVKQNLKKGSDYYDLLYTDSLCELGKLAYFMGNNKSAEKYMEKFRKYLGSSEEPDDVVFQVFNIFHAHSTGDEKRRDETIEKFLKFINDDSKMRMDIVEDVIELLDFLIDRRSLKYAKKLIDSIDDIVNTQGSPFMQREFSRAKVDFYMITGDEKELSSSYIEYYKASETLRLETGHSYSKFLELKKSMDRVMSDNKRLLKAANTDELTGLPNRMHLNSYSDEAFQKAYKEQTNLAIELLDIDDFKFYNDTYGHRVGDLCLKALSKELKKIIKQEDSVFCARYGGDEFVIIYQDMEKADILKLSKRLGEATKKLKIPTGKKGSFTGFSLSQGIYSAVPEEKNRIWDFLHLADNALYDIKKEGKDGVKMA